MVLREPLPIPRGVPEIPAGTTILNRAFQTILLKRIKPFASRNTLIAMKSLRRQVIRLLDVASEAATELSSDKCGVYIMAALPDVTRKICCKTRA